MYIVQYARRTSCFSLGLGLAVSNFPVLDCVSYQLREKEIVALAVVRVSSGYCAVLECILYSTQKWTSCFLLGLGLAISIFPFSIVYHIICARKRSLLSAVVRVSNGYCCSFGMYIVQYAKRTS